MLGRSTFDHFRVRPQFAVKGYFMSVCIGQVLFVHVPTLHERCSGTLLMDAERVARKCQPVAVVAMEGDQAVVAVLGSRPGAVTACGELERVVVTANEQLGGDRRKDPRWGQVDSYVHPLQVFLADVQVLLELDESVGPIRSISDTAVTRILDATMGNRGVA